MIFSREEVKDAGTMFFVHRNGTPANVSHSPVMS